MWSKSLQIVLLIAIFSATVQGCFDSSDCKFGTCDMVTHSCTAGFAPIQRDDEEFSSHRGHRFRGRQTKSSSQICIFPFICIP
ncbi:EB domain-containing protein [Caenorhabditis elegans]|uniref:EB domain-containing protein n=1 Tax=Caenorhabditis elegans TaxID=6239 RepID=Q95QW8_CAEEL|nr:EB domain-containing protein [Caenorhabditis elegans]CCD64544.1 EB domain-containing protein [Caenorhabditis elegans]|eukprot:NP_509041.1 Uncharacterized protein CELE_C14F11.7 [Caenorhabditis elegans]